MTLKNDRNARKRPPMSKRTTWIVIGIAVAVILFVIIVATVSGKGFF
jgi:nitrate reductase NapE component